MKKASLKTFLFIGLFVFSIISIVVSFFIIESIIISKVKETESLILRNEIQTFTESFKAYKDSIDKIATDWAYWDEAYKFVSISDNHTKAKFIRENFSQPPSDTLKNLGIDGMIFLDNRKQIIYSVFTSEEIGLYKRPILQEILPFLNGDALIDGFIDTNKTPFYIVLRPITTTSGKKQAGYLLVLKQIDKEFLQKIVPYEFFEIHKLDIPLKDVEDEIRSFKFKFLIHPLDLHYKYIDVYAEDITGQYFNLTHILFKRKISEAGMFVVVSTLVILSISYFLLSLAIWFKLQNLILNPIYFLSRFLKSVVESQDYSLRISESFKAKELEELRKNINILLEQLEESLKDVNQSFALFRAIAENVPAVIFLFDEKFVYVSPKIEEFIGIDSSSLIGKPVDDVLRSYNVDENIIETFKKKRAERRKGKYISDVYEFEISVDGKKKYLVAITATVEIDGKYYGLGIVVDITDRKQLEKKLEKLALEDPLTGLLNRAGFYANCEKLIEIYKRENKTFYLLLFDVNKFKFVNDRYGHNAGDIILKEIGKRVKNTVRDADIASRLGGDEFAIVLTIVNDVIDVIAFLRRLIQNIEQPIKVEGAEIKPTVSIGISAFPKDGTNINELLKRADIAMYKAKEKSRKTGRSEYKFFSHDLEEELKRKTAIEENLKNALTENKEEIKVYYQPILNTNGRVVGFEALARWHSKTLGNVPPSEFITIAEETGLIRLLSKVIFSKINNDIKKLTATNKNIYVSANLSPYDIQSKNFLKDLYEIFDRESKRFVNFEITENAFIKNLEEVYPVLKTLREEGHEILLDDFGTGYSSLTYLRKLPISVLKIDRSFVKDIHIDIESKEIVETIVKLAKILNLKVVAEGVELEEHFGELESIGVDYYQGYLFSEPLPLEDAIEFLKKKNGL